jgi:type IV secretory pathway VirB10-like protein
VRRTGVLLVLFGATSIASAQWAWRDEHGRTVFSDQPPPATIRSSDVLRKPEMAPANPSADSTGAEGQAAASPASPAPPARAAAPEAPHQSTMAEREVEFRKRMKDRADSEKKLADAQAEASRKTEDCERAQGYLKSIESGVRLVHTNPDGTRALLDEEQREAEAQRTRDLIASRCN